jgi:ABC-2 type transport system permease protein
MTMTRVYALEAKYELLKVARMPGFAIPSIAFPVMFYSLFGLVFGGRGMGGINMATYLVATYGAFGVIGAALFGFGVGVAVERGQGWLVLKRASPMPPLAFFAAKMFVCAVFSATIVSLLIALAITAGGVRLDVAAWATMAGTLILGAIPFCALGLAAGYLVGPNAAPAVVNLVYLPMGFVSGLWIPIEVLPSFMKSIAPWMPAYHLGQLALKSIGAGGDAPAWTHITALAGFTVIGLVLAVWGYRRDEDRNFG